MKFKIESVEATRDHNLSASWLFSFLSIGTENQPRKPTSVVGLSLVIFRCPPMLSFAVGELTLKEKQTSVVFFFWKVREIASCTVGMDRQMACKGYAKGKQRVGKG